MKICILTGIFPPDIGGPAGYVKRLAQGFSDRKIEVKLLTYADKADSDIKYNFSLIQVSRKYPKIIRHFVYFCKALKLAKHSDVIYAQNLFSAGIPGLLASKILRKRFIVKVVGDYAWEKARIVWGVQDNIDDFQKKNYSIIIESLRSIQSFLCKRAFKIITPSIYLKSIISGWGVPEQNIEVVYNALEELPNPDISKEQAKKKIGIDGDIILSIGRLAVWKGFLALIDIFPELLRKNPNFKLVIVGEGNERKNLESKIKNLKLEKNVLLTGRIAHQDIPFYFKAADIFVLNSGYEGLPHVVLEAMQFETPIVVSRKGGNVELIQNDFNGFLIEYNDKEDIKNALLKLWQNKSLQTKFIQNSKEKLKDFAWEDLLEKTLKVLSVD